MVMLFKRYLGLFSSILLLSSGIFGQGVLPLETGNYWQYEESDPMTSWLEEVHIGGMQVLPNGLTYYLITGLPIESNFIREVGPKIYAYNSLDSTEYVLYDFSANVGDTISIRDDPYRYIVLMGYDTTLMFGKNRGRWMFLEEGPAWWSGQIVVGGIGLSEYSMEPGITFVLMGAMISGTQYGTIVGVEMPTGNLPETVALHQNYPNPFNPSTTIRFTVSRATVVSLSVYSLSGERITRLIENQFYPSGSYSSIWNAPGLGSGVYYYRLDTETTNITRALLYLK